MIEAWLAAGFFVFLLLMWVVLPTRLVRRKQDTRPEAADGATLPGD